MFQRVLKTSHARTSWLMVVVAAVAVTSATLTVSAGGRPMPSEEPQVLAQAGAPAVVLSKTTVNPAGDTITVTGTGFLPSLATGTRPPLAGIPAGTYIAFGSFPDVWKPSAGAPSSARPTMTAADGGLKWAVPEASRAIVGQNDSVTLNSDGSFTAVISVKRDYAGATVGGKYGIYTYAGSGAVQPLYETFTAVTFTQTGATATASASPSVAPSPSATAVPPSPTAAPATPTAGPASPTAAPASPTAAPKPPATGTGAADSGAFAPEMAVILAGLALLAVAGASVVVRRRS